MKRLVWLAIPALISGCAVRMRVVADPVVVAPPPPPVATVDVEVEPIATGTPEEVTATSEPPEVIYEEPTPSPNPGYVWVGGYWGWGGSDWGWTYGRWSAAPEGQVYIQPYYERVGPNVVYVQGYWGPHDAPQRSYGGERIHFAAAVRPANYHPGDHQVIARRAGPVPGSRPGGVYEKAVGAARPLPRQTAPTRRPMVASEAAHVEGHETGREVPRDAAREPMREGAHENVTEPQRRAEPVGRAAEPGGRTAEPVGRAAEPVARAAAPVPQGHLGVEQKKDSNVKEKEKKK